MIHPELRYELAKYEQQTRIAAAERSSEARAARRARPDHQHSWLAAIAGRFGHSSGAGAPALDISDRVSGTTTAAASTGEAVAA